MWPSRPPRVKTFSYRGYQRYLVTLTTCLRAPLFADPQHAGQLCAQVPPCFSARAFDVLAYCVMPLRQAMRAWKQRTGYDWKQRTGNFLWQPGSHDRVMREHDDARLVVRYILQNPVRAGLVK